MLRLHRFAGLAFLAAILLMVGIAHPASADPQTLKVGIVPYEAPSKLKEQYTPFAEYLGKKLGRPTEVFVAQDYVGVVQALQAGQIDCAYLNPLSYVLFESKMRDTPQRLIPLAMPYVHGSLYYYGVIFTRTDSGINTIADLKGKKMAFTEPTSTSGYLYPYQYLQGARHRSRPRLPAKILRGRDGRRPRRSQQVRRRRRDLRGRSQDLDSARSAGFFEVEGAGPRRAHR